MVNKNQPERWKSSLLAAALAVAGTPFLFDKLASLMRMSVHAFAAVSHAAPVLVVAVGAILLLAEQSATPTGSEGRRDIGGQHEL